jgi:hypothetical protein
MIVALQELDFAQETDYPALNIQYEQQLYTSQLGEVELAMGIKIEHDYGDKAFTVAIPRPRV